MESYSPNLTKFWHPPRTCPLSNRVGGGIYHPNPFDSNALLLEHNETGLDVPPEMFDYAEDSEPDAEGEGEDVGEDGESGGVSTRRRNKIIAGAARSKVSRSSESSLGLSSSNKLTLAACLYYTMMLANCAVVSVYSRL